MADTTISGLPTASAVAATDVLPMDIAAASATQKATTQQLVNSGLLAPGPIGSTTKNTGAFTTISGTGQLTLTNASNYNVYASGAGANYFAGAVAIGNPPITGVSFQVDRPATGGTATRAIGASPAIQSDVTVLHYNYFSYASTAAASFTLGQIRHYHAQQGPIGAGSTVNNQYGVYVESSLTGATNNYGFYSNIASGTGRYNFYAAGTADNYFAGAVGIGISPATGTQLQLYGVPTGATTANQINVSTSVASDVTSEARIFTTFAGTSAAAFTLGTLKHYRCNQSTIGAGSTITNQMGFIAESTLTGATNNYGFYSNIASGTGRYNFYAAGTADNYFAGNTYTASGTTGMTSGFFYIPSAAGAPSGTPTAVTGRVPMYYDTTNNNFYVYNGAWKKVLLA